MKRYTLSFLLVFLCGFSAVASHIVGAELFYDYLGGNNFKITLKLYRNCSLGCDTCAQYGDPEYVQIFDSLGHYIDSIPMPEPTPTPIPSAITNPCLTPDPNICIQQAFYTGTYNFPPIPGGYTLVYQRCCRNAAIQSIPTNTGATYVAHISNDRFAINSSPRFSQLPPLFLCANSYLQFDNSATDPDGDSLSYSLINALDGASSACPNPSPASGFAGPCPGWASTPPYISVPYYPPYSATNPTNSPSNSGNLQIDPVTGLLTGVPNQTGFFIVAVAVSEFRNGVYIDQTIRDYMFIIVQCDIPTVNLIYLPGTFNSTTNYGVYQLDCNTTTVNFNQVSFYNPPPTNVPLTYSWNFGVPGSTTDTSSQQYPVFTYPDTGTYFVTVSVSKTQGGQGCYDTAHALVIIFPTLTADFSYKAGCQDSAVVFTDHSISTTAPLNSWSWDFGDGQSSMLENPTHTYSSPGTYVVSLTAGNTKGCTNVKTDTIVVYPLPAPDFTVTSLCIYDTARFLYTGSGAVTNYFWNFGNGASSTAQNPTEVYTTTGSQNVSLITVTGQGCRDTIVKALVVNPLPVINASPGVKICPFTTTQLSASGGVGYAWSPGSTLSDSAISNPIASPSAATIYHVTVTDANGCTNKDSVIVNLYPIPQINAGPDTSVCKDGANFHTTVQLQATGAVSYAWTPDSALSSTTVSNPIAGPLTHNQTYYVTGIDTNGCKLTDSVTVFDFDSTLQLILDPDTAICDLDTIALNVLRLGDSYYFWTPVGSISDPYANSPFFFPTTTTTYTFTVMNYCYTKSQNATITVHPLPNLMTQGIDSVCIGGSDTLRASGASTYVWQADPTLSNTTIADPVATPTTTDIYYVVGTDTFGCKKKDSVLVYVFFPPAVGIGPDTAFICQARPIQLIATGGVNYTWKADSTLSSLTVANPIATPTDTSWYYVTVYNVHQCHADDSIHVNVQLPVQAAALSPYDICYGQNVQLSASGGFYYRWIPGIWLNDSLISNPVSTPDSTIVYTVRVSNDCFFSDSNVLVTVHQPPMVFAGDDTTIYRNTAATLSGATNGNNYYWYRGDTNSSILDPFSLTTPATPLYTTTYYLYATSAFGCVNLDSVVVSVDPYTLLLIPDAFTPNGDGLNDEFRIVRYLNIELLEEFAVYDRWGEKVFSTDIISDGWNGKYKGHEEPLGVYVWMVKARTYDGQEVLKKGNVTLLR